MLCSPYELGAYGVGMGVGPGALVAAGAVELLREQGHTVVTEEVLVDPAQDGPVPHLDVQAALAAAVRRVVAAESTPVILAGSCSSVLAALAGTDAGPDGGVVWFDAHADLNTPETSPSGFLDGMALAATTGRCWQEQTRRVLGFTPVRDENVVLVGARSIDPAEDGTLRESGIALVPPADLSGPRLPAALRRIGRTAARTHLHVDLDVIDTADGYANAYAQPLGARLSVVEDAVRTAATLLGPRSISLSCYDPSVDDGRALDAALRLLAASTSALVVPGRHVTEA